MSSPPTPVRPAAAALGDALRRVRLDQAGRDDRPLSQEQLARILLVGGKSVVSLFESGRRLPPLEVVDRYGALPGVDTEHLRALRRDAAEEAAADRRTAPPDAAAPVGEVTEIGADRPHPTRRAVLVGGAAFVLGAAVTATGAWWLQRESTPVGAVTILSPRGEVGAQTRFEAEVRGLTGYDFWLDVQKDEELRHHPTEGPCVRDRDRLLFDQLFIGDDAAKGKPFRITAMAVAPGGDADLALRRYAARPDGPDRYVGLTDLPAGVQVVGLGYVQRV